MAKQEEITDALSQRGWLRGVVRIWSEVVLYGPREDSRIRFISLVAEEDEEIEGHILSVFVPSVKYGIKSGYDAPDDAFMVLDLKESSLKDKNGIIKYHTAFGSV